MNGKQMRDFKFLRNNNINDDLLEFVNRNYFAILFFVTQLENDSFRKRNVFKVHDMSNFIEEFRIMLINNNDLSEEMKVYSFLMYYETKHIKLKIEKHPNNNSAFNVLYCNEMSTRDRDFYNSIYDQHQ